VSKEHERVLAGEYQYCSLHAEYVGRVTASVGGQGGCVRV